MEKKHDALFCWTLCSGSVSLPGERFRDRFLVRLFSLGSAKLSGLRVQGS